jgi:hypothetical protein
VKTVIFDAQLKVLAHFVAVENLACAQSDILFAAQGPLGAGDSDDVDQSFRCDTDQIGAKRRRALSV